MLYRREGGGGHCARLEIGDPFGEVGVSVEVVVAAAAAAGGSRVLVSIHFH